LISILSSMQLPTNLKKKKKKGPCEVDVITLGGRGRAEVRTSLHKHLSTTNMPLYRVCHVRWVLSSLSNRESEHKGAWGFGQVRGAPLWTIWSSVRWSWWRLMPLASNFCNPLHRESYSFARIQDACWLLLQ